MYTHHRPMRLARALAPTRFGAGILVTLALFTAACSDSDPASRINAPPLLSSSSNSQSAGASAPSLGTAANFVVLGGAGVTCTASTVTGNVGSKLTVTRTPTCEINGAIHQGDQTAVEAFDDFVIAYDALKDMTCDHNLTGQPLGGQTLSPGVYCFDSEAGLTGQLTLRGGSNGVWVFQIGSALTTGIGSVVMAGGGQACNVYWQTGTAATIGSGSEFLGNILAGSAIEFSGAGSSLVGRALAKTAVTMTGTNVTGCEGGRGNGQDKDKCNQGVGNGTEGCDPGNSNHRHGSNDEDDDGTPGTPGTPGRKGGR